MSKQKAIQVYEHSFLPLNDVFKIHHFVALSKLNALYEYKYFDLKHNGIVFKNYVGIIQVDDLVIEILPKIDKNESTENKQKWQNVLIQMLKFTQKLSINQVGNAYVSKQSIHLLDIYFDLFLKELESLIHKGLIKKYDKVSGNVKSLKGKLDFSKHINKNLVHKERFYTSHQVYHQNHLLHQILFEALKIVSSFSKGTYRSSYCKKIFLDFPEVSKVQIYSSTFDKIQRNRKTEAYTTAINIARLILLNYAPNIKNGSESMLALLFDMNILWEEYILAHLKRSTINTNIEVVGQNSKKFWNGTTIRPDIILRSKADSKVKLIIDTKWKNIDECKVSASDLRQMFVYNHYWKSEKSLLLYPSNLSHLDTNNFVLFEDSEHACAIGKLSIFDSNDNLNLTISQNILNLL